MLGGRKTPQQDGRKLTHRDQIYARILQLKPGSLFLQGEVCTPDEASDFTEMRDYDYVHVVDGYCTGILEGRLVRGLPQVSDVAAAYAQLRGVTLIETGDRTAWSLGIKEWEPIEGYRFYTDGRDDLLSLGHMKIRIIQAPAWLRDQSPEATLFRAIYDLSPKERPIALMRAAHSTQIARDQLRSAAEYGFSPACEELPDGRLPARDTADEIQQFLQRRADEKQR